MTSRALPVAQFPRWMPTILRPSSRVFISATARQERTLRTRSRPLRHNVRRKQEPNNLVEWDQLDLSRQAPKSSPQPEVVTAPEPSSQDLTAAETPPVKAPKPKKPTAPRGVKNHQHALFQHESICYHRDGAAPEPSKADRPPLAAAAKFFEEDCRLLYSAESLYHHTRNDHVPEIVVLGASNAGKSSFLNALVGRMKLARVSQRPGFTTTMNAFGVGPRPKIPRELVRKGEAPPKHSLILVDTPGYGFRSRSEWGSTILKYLDVRQMLRGAVLLIPADKKLQDTDRWMLRTLAQSNTRTLVVLTKADKNGDSWSTACESLATNIRKDMEAIGATTRSSWWEDCGHADDIFATAANMGLSQKLGNGGGMGGVRLAVLEMAGYSLQERIEKKPETATYTGPVISFDDIKWKA